jgi:hypothetical protein
MGRLEGIGLWDNGKVQMNGLLYKVSGLVTGGKEGQVGDRQWLRRWLCLISGEVGTTGRYVPCPLHQLTVSFNAVISP